MSDCKECKWLVKGKSEIEYCLASEEKGEDGYYIINELRREITSEQEWIDAPCFDYMEV